jgi:multidrug efflux pump subunit AcrA (membrane-fusion protein)
MSATKGMMVFVLVLAVTMAADASSKKTNSSKVQPVGSLVAKASLSPVNVTVNGTGNANVNATVNTTESVKSTEKVQVTKRSLGIDKSEGKRLNDFLIISQLSVIHFYFVDCVAN